MNTLREAAQQALEALEYYQHRKLEWDYSDEAAITALRAALARQDEPVEPVAYTTGHCENHKQKGGCQLHNLQCGWPDCDRKPTTAPPQRAEPVEPVAWKQGNLVTFNEDPYPALGGLFVQFWDGEEVAARVYANDLKTLRQRCAKVNTAPPQRKPLPKHDQHCVDVPGYGLMAVRLVRAVERAHGIKE